MRRATPPFLPLVLFLLGVSLAQEYAGHALFVRTPADARSRVQRAAPASPADVMAQNILEWIQGIYRQGARKIRQQETPGYLPPYSTQRPPERPRPFQAPSTPSFSSPNQNEVNYRPSSLYTPQGFPSGQPSSVQVPPFSTPRPTFGSSPSSQQPFGSSTSYNPGPTPPAYSNTGSSAFPPLSSSGGSTTYLPPPSFSTTSARPSTQNAPFSGGISTNYGYASSQSNFGTGSVGSSVSPGYSTAGGTSGGFSTAGGTSGGFSTSGGTSGGFSTGTSGFSGSFSTPGGFSTGFGYSSQRPTPSFPTGEPSYSGSSGFPSPSGFTTYGYSSETPTPSFPTPGSDSSGVGYPGTTPGTVYPRPTTVVSTGSGSVGTPGVSTGGTSRPGSTTSNAATGTTVGQGSSPTGTSAAGATEDDDDLKHPPHIHALDVECSKTMMTINIEFNRAFDGVIYSKGFYQNPECRYVAQNSGQTTYSFTVSLDSCGTQFINDFEGEAGQAYLENVLVLQNEPGIQEVWDTVRRVRCLWEGNINKALSVNFSVDMLSQEIVTFSGDTASAKLDIQVGRGPFAPAADGLVKIGETMTLVVSVEGDPAFDLQVRDCLARDESSTNTIQLTDERGCILKPKLFGAFQKTNDTGNTGASIIAYAFFQAFKFPDVMDLFIECNVELCKTDCEACPEAGQQIEPGRRRRSISYTPSNTTYAPLLSDPVRVSRGFKVIMLDDLSKASGQVLELLEETAVEQVVGTTNVCMTSGGFYIVVSFMLSTVVVTTISAATLYVKLQRVYRLKSFDS